MHTYKYILPFCLLIHSVTSAQNDSIEHRVNLTEVVVVDASSAGHGQMKDNKENVQSSIENLMEQINGVSLIKRGNFAQEPTIRGLSAGQINLSIDGMAMFGACTDRMDPISSYIEPNNLQSITASFGANDFSFESSIGGGFDFKTKQAQLNAKKIVNGSVGMGYETNGNAFQSLASLNYSTKKLAINLNGIFRESGNYAAAGNKVVLFSQYRKWNGGFSAKYKLNNHQYLSTQYIQDEGYGIGYPGLPMDVAYAKAKIGSITHLYVNDNKKMDKWETKFYVNDIHHAMDDSKRPKGQVPIHMDMPGTSTTIGFYSDFNFNFEHKNHLNIRVNGYQNRLHAEMTMYPENAAQMFMLTIPDGERSLLGLSLGNHRILSDRLSFSYGGRIDFVHSSIFSDAGKQMLSGIYFGDLTKDRVAYNIFVNPEFKLNDFWNASANISRAMRSATLKEMYGVYLFNPLDAYDYIGNPELKTEKSWNLSIASDFKKGIFSLETQAFSYFFSDYVIGIPKEDYSVMTHGAQGVKVYDNLSSALLLGMEMDMGFRILKVLHFRSRNSFSYARDKEGRALPMIPPFKSVNAVDYELKSYFFSLEGVFASEQNHVNSSFYGEYASSAFTVFNFSARRNIDLKGNILSLNIGLNNVLDTDYYEHLDLMKIPRMGRNLIMQVSFNF